MPGTVLGPENAGLDKADIVPTLLGTLKISYLTSTNTTECSQCAQSFKYFSGLPYHTGILEACEDCFPCLFESHAIQIHYSFYL